MKIKTKYNIGDKVWIDVDNEPTEFDINDIGVTIHKDTSQEVYYYMNENYGWWGEEECFSTKEELLKSL